MINEAAHKKRLIAALNAIGGARAQRLEDRYAVGLLDMLIKLPGLPAFWAEGKTVHGYKFKPTERQFVAGMRWINAGMPVILIGWKFDQMYVSPWVREADIRACYATTNTEETLILTEYMTWRKLETIDGH